MKNNKIKKILMKMSMIPAFLLGVSINNLFFKKITFLEKIQNPTTMDIIFFVIFILSLVYSIFWVINLFKSETYE